MRIANYTDQRAGQPLCARRPLFGMPNALPFSLALALAFIAAPARAEYALNFPTPASGQAQDIYDLHILILWI